MLVKPSGAIAWVMIPGAACDLQLVASGTYATPALAGLNNFSPEDGEAVTTNGHKLSLGGTSRLARRSTITCR
jgi:hypothetical protein